MLLQGLGGVLATVGILGPLIEPGLTQVDYSVSAGILGFLGGLWTASIHAAWPSESDSRGERDA